MDNGWMDNGWWIDEGCTWPDRSWLNGLTAAEKHRSDRVHASMSRRRFFLQQCATGDTSEAMLPPSSVQQIPSTPPSTVFRTWSRNSGSGRCQVFQFWRPELLLTDKSSPVEASRPPASSNPSPLIKQASALPDFLSLHPTSPVITLCCIYLANLRAGPLSSLPVFWLILSSGRVKREARCSFLNICQKEWQHLQVLCALILPAVMQSLEMRFLFLGAGGWVVQRKVTSSRVSTATCTSDWIAEVILWTTSKIRIRILH